MIIFTHESRIPDYMKYEKLGKSLNFSTNEGKIYRIFFLDIGTYVSG